MKKQLIAAVAAGLAFRAWVWWCSEAGDRFRSRRRNRSAQQEWAQAKSEAIHRKFNSIEELGVDSVEGGYDV